VSSAFISHKNNYLLNGYHLKTENQNFVFKNKNAIHLTMDEKEIYNERTFKEYREMVHLDQMDWIAQLEYQENVPKLETWESYKRRILQ
jgi:hypothetical protein